MVILDHTPRISDITVDYNKYIVIDCKHIQFISIKRNKQEKDWYVHFPSNASPVARAIMRLAEES